MKVGILTFHGAHNYGSMLQVYALQNVIMSVVGQDNCEIINLRKKQQKDYYSVFNKNKSVSALLGNIYNLQHYRTLSIKHKKFEEFLDKYLCTSVELASKGDVSKIINDYDCVVCGSDQIWNMESFDFDDTYMLSFDSYKGRKCSYAASFGGDSSIIDDNKGKVIKKLSDFDFVSVREIGVQTKLSSLLNKNIERMPDPTLLLSESMWKQLADNGSIENNIGDYIFFYSLGASKKDIELIEKISRKTGYPIVISNTSNRNDKMMKGIRKLDSGPIDFLNMINNAKLVCTSSFHCTLFSILFSKSFFCLNVENEERISSLLHITGLENRNITNENLSDKIVAAFDNINFEQALRNINSERVRALDFINKILE